MSRQFDFVFAGSYAPGADDPGYRSYSHFARRDDRMTERKRERAFFRLQQLRTFDWAFVQSGWFATPDDALEFVSSARALAA